MRKISSKDIKKHFIMTIAGNHSLLCPAAATKETKILANSLWIIIITYYYKYYLLWKCLFLTSPTVTNGNFHIHTTTKYCVHRLSMNYFLTKLCHS